MNLEKITRNVEEIVTLEELKELIERESSPSVYTGYEPSGKIHLGHMVTVNKLIDLREEGFRVTVLLADLHAYLNEKGSMEEVREIAEYNRRCFQALGLEDARYVLGSDYQTEREYIINVLKLARETSLRRAKRSMDEVSRNLENPMVSQMIYPLMQAVDIATLGVDVALGGMDQRKIHMLAREGLPKIGFRAPICMHTPIITGLDGKKMSSSLNNFISVDDSEEEIYEKMRKAFCPPEKIEGNPVMEIYRYHIFPRFEVVRIERDEKFGGDVEFRSFEELKMSYLNNEIHPLDLKISAARYLNEIISPVREKVKKGW
ncbi:MAG: tyrosyl-tRNA synthetase [Archaeoglobi archaeon]|nr:tyrosine--tRNA ligase [Candidatus Mnemosynella bozhongmuii]MDI3502032.1 tyrosyl-tRNA synthetase [Archaeoglobi archaeon]MDK2781290.1 tyrosyl-tRNA synthetase [Archaeoglobi archaeon]